MTTKTIRIRARSHATLQQIAETTGQPMQDALDSALEEYRRRLYLEGLSADYAALRADPKAAADFNRENALWDRTSGDGLEGL